MTEEVYRHGNLKLSCYKWGRGSRVVFAFHGFGRTAHDFAPLAKELGEQFTLIAFNLFFHEGSSAPGDRIHAQPLHKDEWKAIIESYMDSRNIQKATLVGYSLGGRLALCLFESMPERVERMLLFAPDGLKMNWWYKLVSRSRIGKRIYDHLIDDPAILFRIVDAAHSIRIVDAKLRKFVSMQMDTREKRQRVYDVWLFYRLLFPDMKSIKPLIAEQKMPIDAFFGRGDSIIPFSQARVFEGLKSVRVHQLEAGHQLMRSDCFKTAIEKCGIKKPAS